MPATFPPAADSSDTAAGNPLAATIGRLWSIQANRELLLIWAGLRLLTWIYAIAVSALLPLLPRERAIPAWPPAAPVGAWLERLILAPYERRDAIHFAGIVANGYLADNGSAQFHPLLPWLAMPIGRISGSPLLGLMLVGSLAALLLMLAFEHLARQSLPQPKARIATLLLVFSPLGFVLFAPYTEGLFLLCAVLCLLWARQRRWWLAGLAGGMAVLARQQGLFLLIPLAWELWNHLRERGLQREGLRAWLRAALRPGLALGLVPLGLLIWLVFRGLALGDLQPNLAGPQQLIYSLLISPSASKVVPVQAFLPPWQVIGYSLSLFAAAPRIDLAIDLVLGLAFLPLVALAWPRMRPGERAYTIVILLISFAYYTGPVMPYMGLPRHLLLAFPVFVGLAPWLRGRAVLVVSALGFLAMLFLQLLFHIHNWVP